MSDGVEVDEELISKVRVLSFLNDRDLIEYVL